MKNRIQIRMLGEFSLACGDCIVSDKDNRSKKVWTLLEYLIAFHTAEISRETLLGLLWPCAEGGIDSENALKTLLHRARAVLDSLGGAPQKLILHRRGAFQWNNSADFELDLDLFHHACSSASDPELSDEEQLEFCVSAFRLYRGRFLPKNTEDDWVIPVAEYYHSLYIATVHRMIELLISRSRFDEVIRTASAASAIDPYDELLHYHLIRSLYMTGRRRDAVERYHEVLRLFYDKFGINPSEDITNLYKEIIREELFPVADLNIIKGQLREHNAKKRAYFCDFSVFKNFYHVEARSALRSGLSVFLCLITLEPAGGAAKPAEGNSLMASAMARMADTIGQSLRAGDVYARYSACQYIIMVSAASYENCTKIGQRITEGFSSLKPKLSVRVFFTLSELEPLLFESDPHAGRRPGSAERTGRNPEESASDDAAARPAADKMPV